MPDPEELDPRAAALEAAGARVLAFRHWGTFDGDWWALVEVDGGERAWVNGWAGSCASCDPYETECGEQAFICVQHDTWDVIHDHPERIAACPDCQANRSRRSAVIRAFGARHLADRLTPAAAEARCRANLREGDLEAEVVLTWMRRSACTECARYQ